jgi:2-polyprenyl-3-methyl-5-hydroxy-6-metoxy-1,4-benzoquinol methylase
MNVMMQHTTDEFQNLYLGLRKKEQWLCNDSELLNLPVVDKKHPHYIDWTLREESWKRLKRYLSKKMTPMKVLEVGCGNGWLSHRLSDIPGSVVTGIDINAQEIQQAKKVFNQIAQLRFLNCSVSDKHLDGEKFDIIVFAASLQYFSLFHQTLNSAITRLEKNGEIHIIDTPLYSAEQIGRAKQRSATHFEQMGFPKMELHYFHHTWDDLHTFNYKLLYRSGFLQRHIYNNKNPFPWIRIKQ